MSDFIDSVVGILQDVSALGDALDQGVDHVIHVIGEVVDDYITTISPPYAIAKSACNAIPECEEHVVEIRDEILTALMRACGLYDLLEEIVKLWRAVPRVIKTAIKDAAVVFSDLGAVFDDPSVAHIAALVGDCVKLITDLGGDLVALVRTLDAGVLVDKANPLMWLAPVGSEKIFAASLDNPVLAAPLNAIGALFNGDWDGIVTAFTDAAAEMMKAISCLLWGCDNTTMYYGEYDWWGHPFMITPHTLDKLIIISGGSIYLSDPARYCLGNKLFGGPVLNDQQWKSLMAADFFTTGAPSFIQDLMPLAWVKPPDWQFKMLTKHLPGIPDNVREKARNAIVWGGYSNNRATVEGMLADLDSMPKGNQPNSIAWLTGPLDLKFLDDIYYATQGWGSRVATTATGKDFNKASRDAIQRLGIDTKLTFSMIVDDGKTIILDEFGRKYDIK